MNAINTNAIIDRSKQIEPWVIEIRRRLHQTPELLYELHNTTAIVQSELDKLGVSFEAGIAETGVVATIGDGDAGCVALRADMDALPIHEEADVDFKSKNDGKMHACGHDCHTSMLLGAAKLLKEMENDLPGKVKLFFQPAEEGGAGAKKMCDAGVMANPDVEKVFGIHVWPMLPSGQLTGRSGSFLAATNSFKIVVAGKGGHAALPQLAIDPVATAAKIILETQTLVSREQDPLEPCVISFTKINGGSAHNVIPDHVEIGGTIRSLSSANKDHLKERLTQIATGVSEINRCTATVSFVGTDYPATCNDPQLWDQVFTIGQSVVGEGNFPLCEPVMGGEDFAFFGDFAPTCFVAVGCRNEPLGCVHGLHTPKFKADETVFHVGTALHLAFVLDHFGRLEG